MTFRGTKALLILLVLEPKNRGGFPVLAAPLGWPRALAGAAAAAEEEEEDEGAWRAICMCCTNKGRG